LCGISTVLAHSSRACMRAEEGQGGVRQRVRKRRLCKRPCSYVQA
jgi:hypothetical protein